MRSISIFYLLYYIRNIVIYFTMKSLIYTIFYIFWSRYFKLQLIYAICNRICSWSKQYSIQIWLKIYFSLFSYFAKLIIFLFIYLVSSYFFLLYLTTMSHKFSEQHKSWILLEQSKSFNCIVTLLSLSILLFW